MLAHRLKRSKPAFVLLTISGLALLVISFAIIVAGCFLLYHGHFQESSALEKKIEIEFDYSHYWLGGIYLITASLALWSACHQNKRRLTFITAAFLSLATVLSLFAIVLDSPDWIEWKNIDRTLKFWKNKDDIKCLSYNTTCVCEQASSKVFTQISTMASCNDVKYLAAIYGIIVGGAIIGWGFCLVTLLVMVNSVSWKNPWKAFASYTASYENKIAVSSLSDAMQMYRDHPTRQPTMVSSSASSLARHSKEYMPAWSLYGSNADEINEPDPYTTQR